MTADLLQFVMNVTERNTTEPSVPFYLPLFSVVIAISAFSAIFWSFYCHRQNITDVEEANFEFYHMTIQGLNYRHQDPVTIKKVVHKAKLIWGFWRARAYRKVRDVVWRPAPRFEENEMQDVTEPLVTTRTRPYNTTGVTAVKT